MKCYSTFTVLSSFSSHIVFSISNESVFSSTVMSVVYKWCDSNGGSKISRLVHDEFCLMRREAIENGYFDSQLRKFRSVPREIFSFSRREKLRKESNSIIVVSRYVAVPNDIRLNLASGRPASLEISFERKCGRDLNVKKTRHEISLLCTSKLQNQKSPFLKRLNFFKR